MDFVKKAQNHTKGHSSISSKSKAGSDDWVRALFDRIDAKDTNGWLEYLSNDARFYFGAAPPVDGKNAIRNAVNEFLSSVAAINHDIVETWASSDAVICRGHVNYTRKDGSALNVPFANVFKLGDNGLIREYLIYADISKL